MSRTQTLSPHSIDISAHARNKKNVMTGGGRAWREDEEAYLLRTRLQKMPYKHIAAHLNKTELACRLHYHQLSHGSSRRKRTASTSSGSDRCSPVLPSLSPSPSASSSAVVAAAAAYERVSRSISPPRHHQHHRYHHHHHQQHPGRFAMTPPPQLADVQLPGLVLAGAGGSSPVRGAPTILPKPAAMVSRASSPLGYPPALSSSSSSSSSALEQQQSLPPFRRPSSSAQHQQQHHLPLPSTATPHSPAHVDLHRLQAVYAAHRDKFWDQVAADYGCSAGPAALETAWRSGRCCGGGGGTGSGAPVYGSPASPKEDSKVGASRDKTRISSIISAD